VTAVLKYFRNILQGLKVTFSSENEVKNSAIAAQCLGELEKK